MTDITLCVNGTCDLRSECYRFMCPPHKVSPMQSFALFEPTGDNCEQFMEMKDD